MTLNNNQKQEVRKVIKDVMRSYQADVHQSLQDFNNSIDSFKKKAKSKQDK